MEYTTIVVWNHNHRFLLWFTVTSQKHVSYVPLIKKKISFKEKPKKNDVFHVIFLYFFIIQQQNPELLNLHLNCSVVHCRGVSRQQFYMQLKRVDRNNMQNS